MYFATHFFARYAQIFLLDLLSTILLFASFIPLYHVVAQSQINVYEFSKKIIVKKSSPER
jgi:hypothetical protein